MTCSDVQRVLPEVFDGGPNSAEFETHVRSCPDCSDLVSDLKLIASEAHQLAATDEPSPRVWLGIAAQLRAEGLIYDPDFAPGRPVLVPASSRRRWSALWLAPAAAMLLAAGAYVVNHKPSTPVAQKQTPEAPVTPAKTTTTETTAAASAPTPDPTTAPVSEQQQLAQRSAPPRDVVRENAESAPSASAEDQQFLSVVSTRAPSMRNTYESQLKAVNADIRETQAYVKQYPGDMDARQHLMDAYQQKALLYQIGLDRIQ